MSPARLAIASAGLLLIASVAMAAAEPTATIDSDLLRTMLEASIDDPSALDAHHAELESQLQGIVRRFSGPPTYRRARRLHQYLHRHHLLDYRANADGLHEILDGGRYNCVSSTLFYGLILQALGYRTDVLGEPGHLLLRLTLPNDETVDVETTHADGFDVRRYFAIYVRSQDGEPVATRRLSHLPEMRHIELADQRYWRVPLAESVGFVWINWAWRALENDKPVRAAEYVRQASRHLSTLTERAQGVRQLLVKAFHDEYNAGRFANAYEVAAVETELFPDRTVSRDRLLAAALKRIEFNCEADLPGLAADILHALHELCKSEPDLNRIERQTWPMIAATSVRLSDWNLARYAAARYGLVESDPVEAIRLSNWVELRSTTDTGAVDDRVCTAPDAEAAFLSVHSDGY